MREPSAHIRVLVLLAAIGLVIVACGEETFGSSTDQPADEPATNEIIAVGDEPVILVHNLDYGPDLGIEGTLVDIADAPCLAFEFGVAKDETWSLTPIWPKGVTPVNNDGDRGVDIPGHGVVTSGQTISAGGAFWDAGDERAAHVSVPAGCLREDGYVVFNPDLIAYGPRQ